MNDSYIEKEGERGRKWKRESESEREKDLRGYFNVFFPKKGIIKTK